MRVEPLSVRGRILLSTLLTLQYGRVERASERSMQHACTVSYMYTDMRLLSVGSYTKI